jgi:DNA end-binding protein Ku
MAARAISSATISFGLVSIPVKLFTPHESGSQVQFHLLHQCGSRLKQQYVCPKDERVVPREEMVKGYEVSRGQYVLFTNEELKALEEAASKLIEITEFVPADRVDALYYDRAYYLGPDKGGEKPYKLLAEAMRQCGRSALARYAARGKQYLVLIRPFDGGLLMQQLHYADEIRPFSEVEVGDAAPKAGELELAVQLIEQIASDEFHPERYHDAVKERVEQAVAQRVAGQEFVIAASEEPQAQIIDLMEALRRSLAEKGVAAGAAPKPRSLAETERKGPKRAAAAKPRPAGKAARSRKASRE